MNDLVKRDIAVAITVDQHPAEILADYLENHVPDNLFKMESWFSTIQDQFGLDNLTEDGDILPPSCGTTGCIAGHALMSHGYSERDGREAGGIPNKACEILGLTEDQAASLFYDMTLTKEKAIEALRHFAATGDLPSYVHRQRASMFPRRNY